MSASQCRCCGPTEDGAGGRTSRRDPNRPRHDFEVRRAAVGILGALVILGAGLFQAGPARGQESQAKTEAATKADADQAHEAMEPLSRSYRFIETYGLTENPMTSPS